MREVDFLKVDLNLLVILRALLQTRSVSLTAERLGLSQPAVSRALARLRGQFGDRLLIKGGQSMTPTRFAEQIAGPLSGALSGLETFLDGDPAFDPATTERVFRIATTDYGAIAVMPGVLPLLRAAAPSAGMELVPFNREAFRKLGEGDLDIVLYSDDPVAPHLHKGLLFTEDYVCVVRAGHPVIKACDEDRIPLDDYLAHGHALVTVFGGRSGVIDDALAQLGRRRHIAIWLPYFATAALLAAASDLVLTVPRRVAVASAAQLGLVILHPPFNLDPFGYQLVWHERTDGDAGCVWLRSLCLSAMGVGANPK